MKKFFLVLFLLVGGLTAAFLFVPALRENIHYIYFFETTPPEISAAPALPTALGGTPTTLTFSLNDARSGVDEVIVRVTQGGKETEIFKKNLSGEEAKAATIEVPFDPKGIGLKEGACELTVTAFDKSLWNNKKEFHQTLLLDYIRPRLEVLTVQHNGAVGGALLTFYRVLDSDLARSGISDGTHEFPGYPAHLLDPEFQGTPNVYFSLYPILGSFDPVKDKLKAFAVDQAGNKAEMVFYQKIRPTKFKSAEMKMPRDFYIRKVDELLPKYEKETGATPLSVDPTTAPDEVLIDGFKRVNEKYRAFLGNKLSSLLEHSAEQMLWQGVFMKPMPAAPTATFGERRNYLLEGKGAGESVHMGVDLAQTANSLVRASNAGKVVYADDLGIYGNAVVIDHGFGVATLYGHLSSFLVNQGDSVLKGSEIGRTGATGLAGGDHLHFEIRVRGYSVTPTEWIDDHWIEDHITKQILFAKDQIKGRKEAEG